MSGWNSSEIAGKQLDKDTCRTGHLLGPIKLEMTERRRKKVMA
jgi:hypothetical protein